ncbi:MAG: DUF1572 domain-containing protein [Chitinophagaceae bacterium]|nr:DUF1572 domain-containing protein [Chitinophagaceae bacterium]
MTQEQKLATTIIEAVNQYLIEENFTKLHKCITLLTNEQIWFRPTSNINSIGNIVLHLCGNISEWILNAIDGQTLIRKRNEEFTANNSYSKQELLELLSIKKAQVVDVLKKVNTSELLRIRKVQVYDATGTSVLLHVTEHFSYHVGQVAYQTKILNNISELF